MTANTPATELHRSNNDTLQFRRGSYRFPPEQRDAISKLFKSNDLLGPWLDYYVSENVDKSSTPAKFFHLPIIEDRRLEQNEPPKNRGILIPLILNTGYKKKYLEFGARVIKAGDKRFNYSMVAKLTDGSTQTKDSRVNSGLTTYKTDLDEKKTPTLYDLSNDSDFHNFLPTDIDYQDLKDQVTDMMTSRTGSGKIIEVARAVNLLGGDLSKLKDVLPGKVVSFKGENYYFNGAEGATRESAIEIHKKFELLLDSYPPKSQVRKGDSLPGDRYKYLLTTALDDDEPGKWSSESLMIPLKKSNSIDCTSICLGTRNRIVNKPDNNENNDVLGTSLTIDFIPEGKIKGHLMSLQGMCSEYKDELTDSFGQKLPPLYRPTQHHDKLRGFSPDMIDTKALANILIDMRKAGEPYKSRANILLEAVELLGAKIPPPSLSRNVSDTITSTVKTIEDKLNSAVGWKPN